MKHPNGTYDLTIEDIHEIREETSKVFKTMSNDEIIAYLNNETKKFNDRKKSCSTISIMCSEKNVKFHFAKSIF